MIMDVLSWLVCVFKAFFCQLVPVVIVFVQRLVLKVSVI